MKKIVYSSMLASCLAINVIAMDSEPLLDIGNPIYPMEDSKLPPMPVPNSTTTPKDIKKITLKKPVRLVEWYNDGKEDECLAVNAESLYWFDTQGKCIGTLDFTDDPLDEVAFTKNKAYAVGGSSKGKKVVYCDFKNESYLNESFSFIDDYFVVYPVRLNQQETLAALCLSTHAKENSPKLILYDMKAKKIAKVVQSQGPMIWDATWSADSTSVYYSGGNGGIYRYDLTADKTENLAANVQFAHASNKGKKILLGAIFNKKFAIADPCLKQVENIADEYATAFCWSNDDKKALAGVFKWQDSNGALYAVNPKKKESKKIFDLYNGTPYRMSYSKDDRYITSGSAWCGNNTVAVLYDTKEDNIVMALPHTNVVTAAQLNHEQTKFASGSFDKTVQIASLPEKKEANNDFWVTTFIKKLLPWQS